MAYFEIPYLRHSLSGPTDLTHHVQEITRIDPYEKESYVATLRSGAKIPVSQSGYGKLKGVLGCRQSLAVVSLTYLVNDR
jgi:hypothetical protein